MIGLLPGGPFHLPVCFVFKVWANPKIIFGFAQILIVGKTETVLYINSARIVKRLSCRSDHIYLGPACLYPLSRPGLLSTLRSG
jgi:hypothetical protein